MGNIFLTAQHSPGAHPEAQAESGSTGLHDLRDLRDLQTSSTLAGRQGMPCFPHPLPGASPTGVQVCVFWSHRAGWPVEGRTGKACWAVWSLLLVVCSVFPQKTLKEASVEQLSQLQKCLEGGVVRGVWRREAGEINLAPTGKWTQTPAVCI